MKNGYYFLYRLLGILVNMYAYVILLIFVMTLFSGGPGWIMIGVFLCVCLVIYSTLSGRFGILVLMLKKPIRFALKEWINVNAYISIVVYGILLLCFTFTLTHLGQVVDSQKQIAARLPEGSMTFTKTQIMAAAELWGVISLMVVGHCIWTLRLVRRFRDFFQ